MSVKITGLAALYKKLDAAAATKTLEAPMSRAVYLIQAAMQNYPPAPADSTYVRTGTYGRRWTTKITRAVNGISGRVGNNTRYAPWVGSQMFQTGTHRRTGWPTDAGAVAANQGDILADFQEAIDRALAS